MKITDIILESTGTTEHYNGIDIYFEDYGDGEIFVQAMAGERELGYVLFVKEGDVLVPRDLEVGERFRNQGIASTMYDYVKSKGYTIRRSYDQTPAGAGFWDKHKPGEKVWEELNLQKNIWTVLLSAQDKQEAGQELVDLVQHAYSNTKGSMVNSLKDVVPSDWQVIDWDDEPDIDACIFYRRSRAGETWQGYKLQGLGHDGTRTSKHKAIEQMTQLLRRPGVWIESSDALRHVLNKLHTPAITDQSFLQRLFNDPELTMVDRNTYRRRLQTGQEVIETVFGNPKLK